MKNILLIFFFCLLHNSYSQQNKAELFPSGLNFEPLKASNQEGRLGLIFVPENNNMKLDIGNAVDIFAYNFNSFQKLTAGMEFHAYALSTSYAGKRLQIDAVDGVFGGNLSYSDRINDDVLSMRLRILHNSAHLVDGHWDGSLNKWINDDLPVPFAKDFAEYTFSYQHNLLNYSIKGYGGLNYAFLIRPSDIKRLNVNFGFELGLVKLLGPLLGVSNSLFLAHHITLSGTSEYMGSNNSLLGIKVGNWNDKGIIIFASYYSGFEIFHSFYKKRVKRFGIGFATDLF